MSPLKLEPPHHCGTWKGGALGKWLSDHKLDLPEQDQYSHKTDLMAEMLRASGTVLPTHPWA